MSSELQDILQLSDSKELRSNEAYKFRIMHARSTNQDFQILFTDGLRSNEQEVNEENVGLEKIELYILLPAYWNLDNDHYPVEWLERIAAVPQKNNTWFGNGDTIPAGNPAEELSENFSANHFILRRPKKLGADLDENWESSLGYRLLSVIPIYQNEIDFKLKNSHSMLFKKMDALDYTEMWDVYRQSCIRSLFNRFFSPHQMR